MKPVSLITTVRNESQSIREFMDALLNQSRMPDEIVIVDGGSSDDTVEILRREYEDKHSFVRVLECEGNIAKGRNYAIENARYDVIAVTDAGCKTDKEWLKNLTLPFEEDNPPDVVGGVSKADNRTSFNQVTGAYLTVTAEQMKQRPQCISSRNIAFIKDVWRNAGKYPEWLDMTGEDTLFDKQMEFIGARFQITPDAIVYWNPAAGFGELFQRTFRYARGNGQAILYVDKFIQLGVLYLIVFFLCFLGLITVKALWMALLLYSLYLIQCSVKLSHRQKKYGLIPMVWLVRPVMDMANISGYIFGFLSREDNA